MFHTYVACVCSKYFISFRRMCIQVFHVANDGMGRGEPGVGRGDGARGAPGMGRAGGRHTLCLWSGALWEGCVSRSYGCAHVVRILHVSAASEHYCLIFLFNTYGVSE